MDEADPAPPPARLPPRDLCGEAAAGLLARPARVALTVLGTVIGVGALVATLGLSKTAGNQIVGRFSEVAATDVVVTPVPGALGGRGQARRSPGTPRPACDGSTACARRERSRT